MIAPSTIDEIIDKAPIVEIISRDVKLKRAGREWRGLSPFKNERTPSFYVSDVKRRFFDFASGKHGTVIKFLMELHRWTFPEVCELLAGELGIRITGTQASRVDRETKDLKVETQMVLDKATAWFHRQLAGNETAKAYALSKRGLTVATIKELGLGYAPASKTAILNALEGFSARAIEASGLMTEKAEGREPISFYRDRLIFPIRDRRGRVVSFGARAIGADQEPKYLNGREGLLFAKSRTLYGLSDAEKAIRDQGFAIVMEGYLDVTTARQAGIHNCVAPLGTALSLEQAWLLWRLAPEIRVCLDGDEAGDKASARLLETALPALAGDRRLGFVAVPDGLDPDDHIRVHGRARFDGLVAKPESSIDRLWRSIEADLGGSRQDREATARKLAKERTEDMGDAELRDAYRRELSSRAWKLGAGLDVGDGQIAYEAPSVPGREAAIAYAVATNAQYADASADRLGAVSFSSPLARSMVGLALAAAANGSPIGVDAMSRDLAILRSCIPQPAPTFVMSYNAAGFDAALTVQQEQERRRRLRALS